jgi:hypothetical protein
LLKPARTIAIGLRGPPVIVYFVDETLVSPTGA